MDGLVEELLRLESAKHEALVLIDATTYETSVREQLRLLSVRKDTRKRVSNLGQLLTLSQLITLNARLLQNLISINPRFAFNQNGYTAQGKMSAPVVSRRVSVQA
jgi:hypothetical protein